MARRPARPDSMPTPPPPPRQVRWVRRLMTVTLLGLLLFLIGLSPDLIGMNRSPAVGFVQVGVWLTGLAVSLLGAYAALRGGGNGRPTTPPTHVRVRLAAPGPR